MKSALAFLCLLSLALSEPIPQQPPPEILRTLQLEDRAASSSDRQTLLNKHNEYRRRHNAPALTLDNTLNNDAQEWADHMARYDLWDHDDNRGNQGENLFSGSNPLEASELWYGEYPQFPEKDNYMEHIGLPAKYVYGDDYTMDKADGHFTQLVWKGTRKVGFGHATSRSGKTYVVARYSPPGNTWCMEGQTSCWTSDGKMSTFLENVDVGESESGSGGGQVACGTDTNSWCGASNERYCRSTTPRYKEYFNANCEMCGNCQKGVQYTKRTSGSCSSSKRITSESECGEAAKQVGNSDTSAHWETDAGYPKGCYVHGSGRDLYYNAASTGSSCSTLNTCLCKK